MIARVQFNLNTRERGILSMDSAKVEITWWNDRERSFRLRMWPGTRTYIHNFSKTCTLKNLKTLELKFPHWTHWGHKCHPKPTLPPLALFGPFSPPWTHWYHFEEIWWPMISRLETYTSYWHNMCRRENGYALPSSKRSWRKVVKSLFRIT